MNYTLGKLPFDRYLLTIAISLFVIGCSKSDYANYCEGINGEKYAKCLEDRDFRLEIAEERARNITANVMRFIASQPEELLQLGLSVDIREKALRVDEPKEFPFGTLNFEKTALKNPELVGKVYVINTGFHSMRPDNEQTATIFLKSPSNNMQGMVQGSTLAESQLNYIYYVCDLEGIICRGDVFLRVVPGPIFGELIMEMIGADVDKITSELLYETKLDFYIKWLAKIEAKKTS